MSLLFPWSYSDDLFFFFSRLVANCLSPPAKFTGYQYGGRPLGITFVKYVHPGPGPEMMEGAEPTEGLTQDQIM